jgi:hypothetical protein
MQKQPAARTLFMGNLPFEIGTEDIRNMLDAHRNSQVKSKEDKEKKEIFQSNSNWLEKIRFEDSGKCKG